MMRKITAIFFILISIIQSGSALADEKEVDITNDNLNFNPALWSVGGSLSRNPATLNIVNQTDKKLSIQVTIFAGGPVLVYSYDSDCDFQLGVLSQPKSNSCILNPNQSLKINATLLALAALGEYQVHIAN